MKKIYCIVFAALFAAACTKEKTATIPRKAPNRQRRHRQCPIQNNARRPPSTGVVTPGMLKPRQARKAPAQITGAVTTYGLMLTAGCI